MRLRYFLARVFMRAAFAILGYHPQVWEEYARTISETDAVDREVSKVFESGVIQPDSHRDALVRIALELGRTKREVVILRLALDAAGILRLSTEERSRLLLKYKRELTNEPHPATGK